MHCWADTNTSIEIYCIDTITGAGSGWYPIPFSDMQQEVSYQWWSNDVSTKFALAEMVVDSAGNVNGGVQFLHNATNNLQENKSSLYSIYPIPATYELNIEANKLENENLQFPTPHILGFLARPFSFYVEFKRARVTEQANMLISNTT